MSRLWAPFCSSTLILFATGAAWGQIDVIVAPLAVAALVLAAGAMGELEVLFGFYRVSY